MQTTIPLYFAHSSKFDDPINKGVTHYTFVVKTEALEEGFPLSVNPRQQKIAGIYKVVKESLESNDGLFFQKNMGITILARSVEIDASKKTARINCGGFPGSSQGSKNKRDIYGIINGGHTYKIIIDANSDQDLDTSKQFVKINVIEGLSDPAQIQAIARAHNTSTRVKEVSLADFMGEFDWMREGLGDDLSKRVIWHENDLGDIDAVDVICLLHCLHPELYPNEAADGGKKKQPTIAYSGKSSALKIYLEDSDTKETFKKFKKILPDVLALRDFIQVNAWNEYKKHNTGQAKAVFVPRPKSFNLINLDDIETMPKNILHRAALLPILASCRALIKMGASYTWKLSSFEAVKEFSRKSLSEYVNIILDDIGDRNPTAWGKDFSLYSYLHLDAKSKYMELSSKKK